MSAAPAIPVKTSRLTLKLVLLALVLGLAAWWGVSWWLSPRPGTGIGRASFEQIHNGMSIQEVIALVGDAPESRTCLSKPSAVMA